jgi:hypothetical protein
MGKHNFFEHDVFDFETIRLLWQAPYDGADWGEVMSAVARIDSGDFESWYRGWAALAESLRERGQALVDPVSRGKANLRASNYMRTAEFFLAADDPRRVGAAAFCRTTFNEGLAGLGVDFTWRSVPYDGVEMETLVLRSPTSSGRAVLVVHGGFDSTLEELYLIVGAGALQRGYDVLIYEGPGQAQLLRRHGKPFTPEWERPAGVALDSLPPDLAERAVVGVGVSFGGHHLARAAAFVPRYDGIILFDYFPSMLDAFLSKVPPDMHDAFVEMPDWMQQFVQELAESDLQIRWALANSMWTFGAHDLPGLLRELGRYEDRTWPGKIEAHTLVMVGEEEGFFPKQLAYDFVDRLEQARSRRIREFTRAEGGHLHCRNGALHLAHEEIFDWIASVVLADGLGLPGGDVSDTHGAEVRQRSAT